MSRADRGFTLIELMITVVIVAILLVVALPAFQAQVIRSHRAAAQAVMLDIANRQQQFFLSDRVYFNKATLVSTGFTLDPDVARHYSYDISANAGPPPTFLITFTPQGRQAADGILTLNDQGVGTPAKNWNR